MTMLDTTAGRSAGLDTLRGLLCLAVFAVHSIPSRLAESGWIAMPVFFVLSGFVITGSLLAAERQQLPQGAQLRRFFTRRALRILPTLLVFLAVMVPIAMQVGNGSAAGWQYALLFTHNLWVMSAAHEFSFFFNHLWSLSVEEQFYLVYPWIFICCRRQRTALLLGALLLAPTARAVLSELAQQFPQWFTTQSATGEGSSPRDVAVYVFGFSHVDAFGLGALLALYGQALRAWFRHGTRLLLVTVMVVSLGGLITGTVDGLLYRPFLGRAGQAQEVWGYSLLNGWACALVAYCSTLAARDWASKMMARLGRISFEFYLMHYPVIALCAAYLVPGSTLPLAVWVALQLLGTLLAALLLHYAVAWLIRPLQRWGDAASSNGSAVIPGRASAASPSR